MIVDVTRTCRLFERYPRLAGKIPWIALGEFPVPIRRMEKLGKEIGANELWVLREDTSGFPYGGNKIRKLEFTLAEARKKNKTSILTFGGIGSNHVLATTIYAKSLGMTTRAIVVPQPVTEHVVQNLRAYAYYGTELILLEKNSDVPKILARYSKKLVPKTYILPMGGSNTLGVLGFVNCMFEINEKIKSGKLPELEEIWVAAGSGGTVAGLMLGAKLCGLKTKIKSVRVAMPSMVNDFTVSIMASHTAKYLHSLDESFPALKFKPADVGMLKDHLGPGYGFVTAEAQYAIRIAEELEGLHLEGTYTGKTLGAMMKSITRNDADKPILYLHSLNSQDCYSQIPHDFDFSALPPKLREIATGEKKDL